MPPRTSVSISSRRSWRTSTSLASTKWSTPSTRDGMPDAGISVIPNADSLEQIRELVRAAEEGGLGFVGIQDHPYQGRFFDTVALIATLLAETKRISLFTDVGNLPLRPPAVMAKAAASLDVLSGGRFELGLGAGGLPHVVAKFGGPRGTAGGAVGGPREGGRGGRTF